MRVVILDRFDMNRSRPLQNGEARNFSFDRITSSGRMALHKADLVLYIDQSYQQPAYVSILKHRSEMYFNAFRVAVNIIIDRYYHLRELSSMVKTKLIPYALKEFIIHELTIKYVDDDFEFITGKELINNYFEGDSIHETI